ncbi:serine/threonine protein kinase [Alkalibacillus haloalkaliphilus]|uniref:serine/threonine protein kinase n=1 Tax=Alkalibacillus haloalkaliphilus TaxID=94136 RepID=UPI00031FBE12|nr:protein kinase [Alkalibacillus haloalkaliphilus]
MSSIHPTVSLYKGDRIQGVWNHKQYRIERLLGEGARGSTYLASINQNLVALKISKDPAVITSESNVLRKFRKAQGVKLGPSLLDVDDGYIRQGEKYSFYVMEYVQGRILSEHFSSIGLKRLGQITSELLKALHQLHLLGFVFGDLKPDNIIIEQQTKQVRLVDVGGVTQVGRGIREYTTFYDRGYWRLGSRKADPQYDLFSLAICMIQADPSNHLKVASQNRDVLKVLAASQMVTPFQPVVKKALLGKHANALAMKREIDYVTKQLPIATQTQSNIKTSHRKKRGEIDRAEVISITSLVGIHLSALYFILQAL